MDENETFDFILKWRETLHEVEEEYICKICKKLLCDPYAAVCGCSFCNQCVQRHFIENNPCPGMNDECRSTNTDNAAFVRSHFLRNKIKRIKMECPNECCSYNSTIEEIIKHFNECNKRQYPCKFSKVGCCTMLSVENVENHQSVNVDQHLNYVLEYINKVDNENNVLTNKINVLEERNDALRENINQISEKCNENEEKICRLEMVIGELENKNADLLVEVSENKRAFDNNIKELGKKMDNEIKLLEDKVEDLEKKNWNMKIQMENNIKELKTKMDNKVKLLKDKVKDLEKKNSDMKIEIKNNVNNINKLQNDIKEVISQQNKMKSDQDETRKESKNQETNEIMPTVQGQPENDDDVNEILNKFNFPRNTASFIWKVENLPQKREGNWFIESNKIYMYPNGYKMGIGIRPNGKRDGENTHLSALFRICVGQFDEGLRWPVQQNISLSLINPTEMKERNIVKFDYGTTPQNDKFRFNKPKNYDNSLYCSKFISWDELNSPNSPMINGTIFVKLTLEKD